jgi:hypothetical protein
MIPEKLIIETLPGTLRTRMRPVFVDFLFGCNKVLSRAGCLKGLKSNARARPNGEIDEPFSTLDSHPRIAE